MEVKEKRNALREFCHSHDGCGDCIFSAIEKSDIVCTIDYIHAPDEQIEIWHGRAFPEPIIKDSGERRQFYDTDGNPIAVRDMASGKGRMDLLPWAAIMEVAKHCENGAVKYGEHNVDKGLPTSSFCDSAARHLAKYLDGWTDEPHLLAAAWNLLWAVQMTVKKPEMVDTPWIAE